MSSVNRYETFESMDIESENIDVESVQSLEHTRNRSISPYDRNNNVKKWLQTSQTDLKETEDKKDMRSAETLCRVCGDISSGRHYGQYTCDGCSGFFMRSVRKNMVYRCKGSKSCIVDKKRRNQCQACRFEKCLKVNMNRYAVQQERQPNSQFHLPQPRYPSHVLQYVYPPRPNYFLSTPHPPFPPKIARSPPIINKEEPPYSQMKDKNTDDKNKDSVLDLSPRLLYHTVKWARSVPAFSELPMNDQIHLLEGSWTEIFILFTFQWNLNVNTADILRNVNLRLGEKELEKVTNELKNFEKLSKKFYTLKVSEDEYIFLKSIVLFKAEMRGLIDAAHIERCQDRAQVMLRDHVMTYLSNQPARFGKLLLLLPEIKEVSSATLEEILFHQSLGTFSFETLLADLFKRQ